MDIFSYILGQKSSKGAVEIEEGKEVTFTDENNDGHVVMAVVESEAE